MSEEQETKNRKLEKRREPPERDEMKKMEMLVSKLEEITTNSRMKDLAYHYTKTSEVIKTNLIAGVSRGVGLTLGTALFLALLFFLLTQLAGIPVVGEYIRNMLDIVANQRES
ncbi:DUF5665 domain-containing protein [Salibacterium qingdaonense]|uniref:Uncharacterized protein n=1 Tax=Salibacterium qingdaonense TaxID=266892 RepID=A0A1I4IFE4_9BACI|nr:DUF5665 domain-containing protein [Salibacterium qingdaonense]SFL53004.1 hypothetical protein SAMN04488054_10216 [Salibacterium qingdaonense]